MRLEYQGEQLYIIPEYFDHDNSRRAAADALRGAATGKREMLSIEEAEVLFKYVLLPSDLDQVPIPMCEPDAAILADRLEQAARQETVKYPELAREAANEIRQELGLQD